MYSQFMMHGQKNIKLRKTLLVIMTPRFPVEIYRSFVFTVFISFTLKVVTPVFSEV